MRVKLFDVFARGGTAVAARLSFCPAGNGDYAARRDDLRRAARRYALPDRGAQRHDDHAVGTAERDQRSVDIYVGQRLLVPVPGATRRATPVPLQTVVHVVQPGETLESIADLYGLTVETCDGAE